ncbi:MAG: hypothetical protein IT449_12330 [Phycisphaerales bacterium]|nr:hypothetical protein [Phycisphaerales bacterium]
MEPVTPAQAGVQYAPKDRRVLIASPATGWIPAFAGMTREEFHHEPPGAGTQARWRVLFGLAKCHRLSLCKRRGNDLLSEPQPQLNGLLDLSDRD